MQLFKFIIKIVHYKKVVHYNVKWDIRYTVLPNYCRTNQSKKRFEING